MIFTLFGYLGAGGGGRFPKGLVHNLLMHFSTNTAQKIEVSETYFIDIVIT